VIGRQRHVGGRDHLAWGGRERGGEREEGGREEGGKREGGINEAFKNYVLFSTISHTYK